ncbi:Archaeal ATPase-domain-containing protein, partial [Endogone sp. FLAS-F59071]
MSYLPRATASAVWRAPIHNLNIVCKSSTALLSVPLHTTRLSPITRISTIGIRHRHEISIVQKALEVERVDNYLGPNDEFFNRKRELKLLSERFANERPKLTIVLGPPSSGKTALVRKAVSTTPNIKPLFIDLREGTFDTTANTVKSLKYQFDSYFDLLKSTLKSLNASLLYLPEVSYNGVEVKLTPNPSADEAFGDLLNEIDSRLPKWSALKGPNVPRPVLVVDEANRFMNLVHTKEGKATVETFLQWLVKNTKQELRFHAVLTSCDAYFQMWLAKRLNNFQTMVVGDLTKSEAEKFFHDFLTET